MSDALKPCPFCDGEAKLVSSFVDQDARVECFTCETRTADFYGHSADENEADARAAWNTRATDAAIADFIPWGAVHERFNWYARDKDGTISLYESCPQSKDTQWRSMGQEFPANVIAGIIIRDKPWDQSLECRPNWEGK